jgi:hypothetical protein
MEAMVQKAIPQKVAGKRVAKKQAAVATAKTMAKAGKKAREDAPEVSTASGWKKNVQGYPLDVPSGNVALVRPVGMQAFLVQGIVPNSLREIAMEAITKKKAPQLSMDELEPGQLEDMLAMFDGVCVYCVLKPRVAPIPHFTQDDFDNDVCSEDEVGQAIPFGDPRRDEDKLFVDEVDMEDKAFIFQFACGGTRSVEQFREEYTSRLEQLSGEQDVAK